VELLPQEKLPTEKPLPLEAAALACAPVIHAQALAFAAKTNAKVIIPARIILFIDYPRVCSLTLAV
jgi:hypothetical protein